MGFLTGGIDYDMIGRLGNHVGRKRKGKNVISMRPSKSHKPPTVLQLDQRIKFGKMISWLTRISGLIDIGFQVHEVDESPMNAALSYNLKHAIAGVSPNFTIDYTKAKYSLGKLSKPGMPEVSSAVAGTIKFEWLATIEMGVGNATDLATVMVYNPVKDHFVALAGAAARSALTYTLLVPGDFSGDTVQCYMSFVSVDGKKVSDSAYLGALPVL